MVNEGAKKHEEDYQSVIKAEVVEIAADSRHCFGIAIGEGEGGRIQKVFPWPKFGDLRSGS